MRCPACQAYMRHAHPNGVEIDVCTNCNGVWLDASELDGILDVAGQRSVEASLEPVDEPPRACRYCGENLMGASKCPACERRAQLRCPHDEEPLYIVDAAGIELDRCPTCQGLWVDGFERCKLSRMRDKLVGQAVEKTEDSSSMQADAAMLMGTMMAGGMSGEGNAISEAFGMGSGEGGSGAGGANGASKGKGAKGKGAKGKSAAPESLGGTKSMREYIEKHGNFQITCAECSKELTRYTAWQRDDEFFCVECGDKQLDESTQRAMRYKSGVSADYWHDERHLVEVLQWMVGGLCFWKKE